MSDPKFNDDLLLNDADRARAQAAYPSVFFALDSGELREVFARHDTPANAAKQGARRAGLASVVLTTIALCGASLASVYHASEHALAWGTLFSALGVVGVGIAFFGVLYGPSKSRWLENRLMTERLRQFHFQAIVSNLALLAGDPQARAGEFAERRAQALQAFLQRFDHRLDAELESVASDVQSADIWLCDRPADLGDEVLSKLSDEVFAAYRDLRLRHQLNYANWKLRSFHSIFDGSLRGTQRLLSIISVGAVLIIFGADVVGVLMTWRGEEFPSGALHLLVPCLAFVALASRAIEEGMQVRVETDRYRNYRNTLRALLGRYTDSTSRRDKVQVMIDTERLVFLEMKAFLMGNHEATFVM